MWHVLTVLFNRNKLGFCLCGPHNHSRNSVAFTHRHLSVYHCDLLAVPFLVTSTISTFFEGWVGDIDHIHIFMKGGWMTSTISTFLWGVGGWHRPYPHFYDGWVGDIDHIHISIRGGWVTLTISTFLWGVGGWHRPYPHFFIINKTPYIRMAV